MKKISTLVGITIIIATAVVLVGGVFAWQYFLINGMHPVKIVQPINQTAEWKTYISTKYQFSFKYPSYMKLDSQYDATTGQDVISLSKGNNPYFLFINIPAEKNLEKKLWRTNFYDSSLAGKDTRDSGWLTDNTGDQSREIILKDYPNLEITSNPVDIDSNMKIVASYPTLIDGILTTFKFTK